MSVWILGVGSSLWGFGWGLGSVICIGLLILALTSLLARDCFFLFAIIGFVVKVCFRIGSEEMRCQFPKMVCLIINFDWDNQWDFCVCLTVWFVCLQI